MGLSLDVQFTALPIDLPTTPASRGAAAESPPTHFAVRAGAPLHVAWRTLYPGDLPHKFLRKKRSKTVVLSSFVKTGADAAKAPRVVSAIFEDLADKDDQTPGARGAGSHILHYDSSVGSDTVVELELVSKSSGGKDLGVLKGALEAAGSTPLLFFASGWINGASGVVKLAGGIMKALSKDKELFSSPITIPCSGSAARVDTPVRLLAARDPLGLLEDRTIENTPIAAGGYPRLKNGSGTWYEGDEPYVIFDVDQEERADLEGFAAERKAGALLADWTPREGVDVGEVLGVVGRYITTEVIV